MQNSFSIIIPTLNEADNIVPLLQQISTMAETSNLRPEVIFVDDGSTDTTCEQILNYKGIIEVILHQRAGLTGLAGAVVAGGKLAKNNNLVIMDGDLSHPPEIVPQLIEPLLANEKDMVIGSRYTAGGSTPDWPFVRKLSSRIATFPAHLLTGIEDPLAGFFSVKKNLLEKIDPQICGFKIGFELLYKYGTEIRTAEVPIRFTDRLMGKSKMRFPILVHYFLQLLKGIGINPQVALHPIILAIGLVAGLLDAGLLALLTGSNINITSSHIVSFILSLHLCFLLGIPILFRTEQRVLSKKLFQAYSHFLLIAILGLFLHGGLLSILLNIGTTKPVTCVTLGLFALLTWLLFSSTLQIKPNNSTSKPNFRIIAAAVIIYSIVLRLFYFGTTELLQEEAYYWNYTRHMASSYLDHPPMVASLIWLGTKLLGHSEVGVRIGGFCCWFFTAYFSYALTRSMFNAKTAINAVLLIATLPMFFASALIMTPDVPLLTCWAATLYFLYQALCKEQKFSWIFAGLFFGLGLTSKYTIVLLGPATLLFMMIDPCSRKWLRSPLPYVAAFVAIVCFSPVIWWNSQNNWASFLFQSHERIADVSIFSTHKLVGSIILLLSPVGFAAAFYSMLPLKMRLENSSLTSQKEKRNHLFLLVMTLTPLLVFLFFSLSKEVKLNWTGPIWLATIPFMAYSIEAYTEGSKGWKNYLFATGWPKTFISLLFIYGIALHYLSIGLPGVPYLKNTILLGWDDFALQVEETANTLGREKGRRPIIVGMDKYRIASGISFYLNRGLNKEVNKSSTDKATTLPLVTGQHIFGRNSLMFSYWHPPERFSQEDFLVLAQSELGVHRDLFASRALQVGNLKEISIKKHNKIVTTFYYRQITRRTPNE